MEQLKTKDDEYASSLRTQNDGIDLLIASMKFQFNQMPTDYSD
jgi:hypothetical protein